jgi:hypothetical protein
VLITAGQTCLWVRIDAPAAFWSIGILGWWSVGLKNRNPEDRRGREGNVGNDAPHSLQRTSCGDTDILLGTEMNSQVYASGRLL